MHIDTDMIDIPIESSILCRGAHVSARIGVKAFYRAVYVMSWKVTGSSNLSDCDSACAAAVYAHNNGCSGMTKTPKGNLSVE